MINVIFWGIVALLIMLFKSEGDDSVITFILFFGACIALAIYGIYTDSAALTFIFGAPVVGLIIALFLSGKN